MSVAVVAASLEILGGQSVQARALLEELRRDGCAVRFVPVNPPFPAGAGWLRRVPCARTLANQALYLPSLLRLRASDVVHVLSASYWSFLLAAAPALLVARALGKRVVLNYHSGEAPDHLARWGALVHPWLRLADVIVVPSEFLRRAFAAHGHPARVVPNVVDLTRFEYRAREPLRPRLLSTRNLERHYRVANTIDAFALLRRRRADATLTIAGSGSLEGELRARAAVVGGGIRFVGRVEPGDMPRLCAEHDVFLNSSVVDNQPVSILEALAAGLSVVSTPTGDIEAMLKGGTAGVIVPPDDPAAMASAVEALLQQPARARDLALRGREEAARYSWERVRDEWREVYGAPA